MPQLVILLSSLVVGIIMYVMFAIHGLVCGMWCVVCGVCKFPSWLPFIAKFQHDVVEPTG